MAKNACHTKKNNCGRIFPIGLWKSVAKNLFGAFLRLFPVEKPVDKIAFYENERLKCKNERKRSILANCP